MTTPAVATATAADVAICRFADTFPIWTISTSSIRSSG
jgi:hypothetical protein